MEKNSKAANTWRKSLEELWAKHVAEREEWGSLTESMKVCKTHKDSIVDPDPQRASPVAGAEAGGEEEGDSSAMDVVTTGDPTDTEMTLAQMDRVDRGERWATLRKYPPHVLETCDLPSFLESLKDEINIKEQTCDRYRS